MTTSIFTGEQTEKTPAAWTVMLFDWDGVLPVGAELVDVGTFTATVPGLPDESPVTLDIDSISLVTGNRKVQFRVKDGVEGVVYEITHAIVMNTTPTQKRDLSFYLWIRNPPKQ